MTCYFAKGNKINGKPYEETGIYRARTKATLFIPLLAIAGLFLHDLAYEVFGVILVIVFSVSVIMTDRLFGKIYPPSRRKAVMQHYAGCKFSPFRRNLFFFSLYLLGIPAMVLLVTALKWINEILK